MSQKTPAIFCRPWLWLPSKLAHDLAPIILPLVAGFWAPKNKSYRPLQWRNLHFDNPLGLAGGVDKSGRSLAAWQRLGAGFLEVGTVTPEPQGPNPGKIMDRDISSAALWNKMGFPNPGMQALKKRLQTYQKNSVPLFINIGKNRWTKNDNAHVDYSKCLQELHPWADAFVVNLSSPNTKGLRDLLSENHLKDFLSAVKGEAEKTCPETPLLLKLSPDMDRQTLTMALQTSSPYVDGWILTNTTKSREPGSRFPQSEGGVSGLPLKELSRQALLVAAEYKKKQPEKLLISTGGVDGATEVQWRLKTGADLVQVYSALVFSGPGFFSKTLDELQKTGV